MHRAIWRELGFDDTGTGPENVIVIGTVANYREQKDYPNLLRAMAELPERGVACRLVAVGQGPLEQQVIAQVKELGLADIVTLTGFRPDATAVMSAFDIFVLASKWEGMPVALMEAFAWGSPSWRPRWGSPRRSPTARMRSWCRSRTPRHWSARCVASCATPVSDASPPRHAGAPATST